MITNDCFTCVITLEYADYDEDVANILDQLNEAAGYDAYASLGELYAVYVPGSSPKIEIMANVLDLTDSVGFTPTLVASEDLDGTIVALVSQVGSVFTFLIETPIV